MNAPKKKSGSSQSTMIITGALIVVVLASLAIYGISRGKADTKASAAAPAPSAGTQVASNTVGGGTPPMPDWLTKANKAIIADYTWAASHHNELQYFPCYCGCYSSAGHVSNSECYYKRDKSGQITAYDAHAYG